MSCKTTVILHYNVGRASAVLLFQTAKLCDSAAGKGMMALLERGEPVLVGTGKCSEGPSYWCASLSHAEECDVSIVTLICS